MATTIAGVKLRLHEVDHGGDAPAVAPVLATFAQGAPASVTGAVIGGSGGSIEPLTFSLKRRRPHVSLTASNACVSFEGKTSEDYTAAAGACRYALAVYNAKRARMDVYPVEGGAILPLHIASVSRGDEDGEADGGAGDGAGDLTDLAAWQRRDMTIADFGSRKKQVMERSRKANIVDVAAVAGADDVSNVIQDVATTAVASGHVLATAGAAAAGGKSGAEAAMMQARMASFPPFDLAATEPRHCYPLQGVCAGYVGDGTGGEDEASVTLRNLGSAALLALHEQASAIVTMLFAPPPPPPPEEEEAVMGDSAGDAAGAEATPPPPPSHGVEGVMWRWGRGPSTQYVRTKLQEVLTAAAAKDGDGKRSRKSGGESASSRVGARIFNKLQALIFLKALITLHNAPPQLKKTVKLPKPAVGTGDADADAAAATPATPAAGAGAAAAAGGDEGEGEAKAGADAEAAATDAVPEAPRIQALRFVHPAVVDSLLHRFTETWDDNKRGDDRGAAADGKRYIRTKALTAKLRAHIAVLTLILDDFASRIGDLALDLRVPPKELSNTYRQLGCSIKTVAQTASSAAAAGAGGEGADRGSTYQAELKAPLTFPSLSTGGKRR